MSLTKSLLLEVHWSLKTTLKPPTTLAWSRNCSNFHLDAKKYSIKMKNSETIKIHYYLQYFELKPVFMGPLGTLVEALSEVKGVVKAFWNLVSR